MSEAVLRTITGDSPEAESMMELVNLWRCVFAKTEQIAGRDTPETMNPEMLGIAATAAAVMAGTFVGNAIVAGLATDQDRRRAAEAFGRNFRSGIDIGKRQGLRIASEMPVGGHA